MLHRILTLSKANSSERLKIYSGEGCRFSRRKFELAGSQPSTCVPTASRHPGLVIAPGSIMTTAIPSIACLGVIGRDNNPLHISIFPSQDPAGDGLAPIRTPLQFSLLLSSTIDVFALRARHNAAAGVGLSGDVGLLHAVDDRLAAYGLETNTGVRMVCVVDMRGRRVDAAALVRPPGAGLRDADLKPVFRAMQAAYVRLLQNPFYDPDEHAPLGGRGGKTITSNKFTDDMKRIGEGWKPGVMCL